MKPALKLTKKTKMVVLFDPHEIDLEGKEFTVRQILGAYTDGVFLAEMEFRHPSRMIYRLTVGETGEPILVHITTPRRARLDGERPMYFCRQCGEDREENFHQSRRNICKTCSAERERLKYVRKKTRLIEPEPVSLE